MKALVFFLAILHLAHPLATYSGTSEFHRHSDLGAVYPLGSLKANDVVTIDVNFPAPTPTGRRIPSFRIWLYDDSTALNVIPNNPVNFDTLMMIPTSPGKVPQASGEIPSDGAYFIVIRSDAGSLLSLEIA